MRCEQWRNFTGKKAGRHPPWCLSKSEMPVDDLPGGATLFRRRRAPVAIRTPCCAAAALIRRGKVVFCPSPTTTHWACHRLPTDWMETQTPAHRTRSTENGGRS